MSQEPHESNDKYAELRAMVYALSAERDRLREALQACVATIAKAIPIAEGAGYDDCAGARSTLEIARRALTPSTEP